MFVRSEGFCNPSCNAVYLPPDLHQAWQKGEFGLVWVDSVDDATSRDASGAAQKEIVTLQQRWVKKRNLDPNRIVPMEAESFLDELLGKDTKEGETSREQELDEGSRLGSSA